MVENVEKKVKVGFSKSAEKVVDEIESVTYRMYLQGWELRESHFEESLGYVHLFFQRNIDEN